MEQPPSSLTNASSFLPSPADLLLAVPRLLSKAGSLGEHIDSVFGKIRSGGSIIAEPTVANVTNATVATTSGKFVQESIAAAASATAGNPEDMGVFQALKNVGSFFSYITSKWAIATFTFVFTPFSKVIHAHMRLTISFVGYTLESNPFLCLQSSAALSRSIVLANRALSSADDTLPLPYSKRPPSYTMSDFA